MQPPEHYVTLIWPLRSSKVKGHNVNLEIIYDFVCVLHINILSYYHRFWYIGKIDNKGPPWTFLTLKINTIKIWEEH